MTLFARREDPVSGIDTALGAKVVDAKDTAGVIRAVIAFANGDTTPPWITRARETSEDSDQFVVGSGMDFEIVDAMAAKTVAEHDIEQERRMAIDVLADAAKSVPDLAKRLRTEQRAGRRSNIRLSPLLVLKSDRISINFMMVGPASNSTGWVLFAAALLGQNARGDRTDLGRCQLGSCRRFFVVERGKIGKPQTKYCCDDHRLEQHALNAAGRQRRSRAAKKPKARRSI